MYANVKRFQIAGMNYVRSTLAGEARLNHVGPVAGGAA